MDSFDFDPLDFLNVVTYSPPPMTPLPPLRPYDHLSDINPNDHPNGWSTEGGPGLFSSGGKGGEVCFEYGIIAHITGDHSRDNDSWEQMLDAIATGNIIDTSKYDYDIARHWIMKDPTKPFSEENIDLDATDPAFHPKKPKRVVMKGMKRKFAGVMRMPSKKKAKGLTRPVLHNYPATFSSDLSSSMFPSMASNTGDNFDDAFNMEDQDTSSSGTSSSGSIEDGQYEQDIDMSAFGINTSSSSGTSSSGTSSSGSSNNGRVAGHSVFGITTSQAHASGTSSPFDALRSSLAMNMVPDYMSSLSPPDESINLTRKIATPVGPSKKKPVMKFTPTSNLNGVNMANFISTLKAKDPTTGDKIEIDSDDDATSTYGQYIEMDLALGVLEEKKGNDINLRSDSSSYDSDSDSQDTKDLDVLTRLTNVKAKGKEVQGKKATIIQEM